MIIAVLLIVAAIVATVVIRAHLDTKDTSSKVDKPDSKDTNPVHVAIATSQSELDQLSLKVAAGAIPAVDFSKNSLAIFTYSAPTPGYQLEVAAVRVGEYDITIHTPGEGCARPQVITTTHGFVITEKNAAKPRINAVTELRGASCPV